MKVICGLGNPGRKYWLTRHNIGFIFLEYIQNQLSKSFKPGPGEYNYCEVEINNQAVILLQPVTYMNLSGIAVHQAIEQFRLNSGDLLIIYDDFHLPFGTLRFRAKGSDGGHNGIKSISSVLGSQKFCRLKIGIGSPISDSVDYVLSDFTSEETKKLEMIFCNAFEGITSWIESGIEYTMNKFNRNILI